MAHVNFPNRAYLARQGVKHGVANAKGGRTLHLAGIRVDSPSVLALLEHALVPSVAPILVRDVPSTTVPALVAIQRRIGLARAPPGAVQGLRASPVPALPSAGVILVPSPDLLEVLAVLPLRTPHGSSLYLGLRSPLVLVVLHQPSRRETQISERIPRTNAGGPPPLSRRGLPKLLLVAGGVLLSPRTSSAVPSALGGLNFRVRDGSGVPPPAMAAGRQGAFCCCRAGRVAVPSGPHSVTGTEGSSGRSRRKSSAD